MNAIVEKLLPLIEVEVEKIVEAKSDALVDALGEELKKLLPDLGDMAVDAVIPKLKPLAKAFLLAQAEKISPAV